MLKEAIVNTIIVATLACIVAGPTIAYVVNAIKFTECDFEKDYKCEVIHGIGLIPSPAAIFTVWFDTDQYLHTNH